MAETIKVGLLGCGTVGTGILRLLSENHDDIVARLGADIEVTSILVRDPSRVRDPAIPGHLLTTDPEVVLSADNHIIVEVMGGYEPAKTLILQALGRGRHVVTANKALLAKHGKELFRAAEANQVDVIFEASVGGGLPIIRTLREGLAADRVESLHAIINGTSNYMLTGMNQRGVSYAAVLGEAQARGYAEADPTMDVGGSDAAQKLSILIAVSFGADIDFQQIRTDGITALSPHDFAFARQFGYAVKPLAVARAHPVQDSASGDGGHEAAAPAKDAAFIEARVAPHLVPLDSMLAHVNGVYNAVRVQSRALGPITITGQGAGMMPTAAAVVSDIIELARNIRHETSGRLPHLAFHKDLVRHHALRPADETECPFYLRFTVRDEPGVIAQIASLLGAHHISIRKMVQEEIGEVGESVKAGRIGPGEKRPVPVVILTHTAREGAIRRAVMAIDLLPFVTQPTLTLRVEDAV